MSQVRTQKFDEAQLALIVTARDTAHHRLLSLSCWNNLGQLLRQEDDGRVYECCRLASMLYSHFVLFPIPSESAGVLQPIDELRTLLEDLEVSTQKNEILMMLLWSSLIGAIASLRGEHADFYLKTLAEVAGACCIESLEDALVCCRRFIWADCACDAGTLAVWDRLTTLW